MNRTMIIIVALGLALYVLVSSVYVVNEREQAIVTRFGEIARIQSEPGLYFKVPTDVVETVQIIEDRILRYELQNITVQVSGGKFYEVDAFLTYKIVDPRLFRERVFGSLTAAEARIATRLNSALRQVYGLRDFNAALSVQRTEMMQEARDLIRAGIADLGIDVVDVRVLRTDLTAQVSQQTYERMKAERLAEAALARASGRERAQSIRATADRQVVEIVALANRDSEILRGEGDARRNAVFADAFGRDTEFFEFYRTMQAYRTALQQDGTSLILSPDSEFFNYFLADQVGGAEPAPQTPLPSATVPQ
jgi:modulator of FtsH protease HflC